MRKRRTKKRRTVRLTRIIQLREWVRSIKEAKGCCVEGCDEKEPCCLDFHHIDAKTKDDTVNSLITKGSSRRKIMNEISKCVVICANHHRKLHAGHDLKFRKKKESTRKQPSVNPYSFKIKVGF